MMNREDNPDAERLDRERSRMLQRVMKSLRDNLNPFELPEKEFKTFYRFETQQIRT